MKPLARYAVSQALLVTSFVLCSDAQTQTKPTRKTTGGQVCGTVTFHGKPAGGVVVAARTNLRPSQMLKATTNEEGKYYITGIPAGKYMVAPIAPAFVTSETTLYGQSGKTVLISLDESVGEVDFTLVRGAAITGKVTDNEGHPVIEDRVFLMPVDRGTRFEPLYALTDDRGIYRIFGIPAGRFKVSVGQGDEQLGSPGNGRTPYRRTFFPDATDPAKAKIVEVAEAAEATNIDIIVSQAIRGFSVSGRIVDSGTGAPITDMAIDLTRTIINGSNWSSSTGRTVAQTDRQGEFTIENLVPGKYSISISPEVQLNLRSDTVAFDVLDQNVTGLLIKTSTGASVEGVVAIEGSHDSSVAVKLAQLYVSAFVRDEVRNSAQGRGSQINADGSFRISGLPAGIADFSLASNLSQGFSISRIERDGVVQPNGIQIQNGERLTGIRIVVSYGNATIRGQIRFENGTLPSGGRLFVRFTIPPDQYLNTRPDLNTRSAEVDSRGHFVIEGLLAGSYEVSADAYVPESRQEPRSAKQLVSLTAGAVSEVTLTIDLQQNPAPARP